MAKLSMKLKQARSCQVLYPSLQPLQASAAVPTPYLRDYGICRICFRELAYKGEIPGVKKASW